MMRSTFKCVFAVALGALTIATTQVKAASRMAGINSSSKYLQYYGSDFSTSNLHTLAQFDVVVLDPNGSVTPANVAYLQSNGVKYVLAYISIGEQMPGTPILRGNADGPVYCATNGSATVYYESNNVASFYVDETWSNAISAYVIQKNGQVNHNGTFGGAYVWPNSDWRWVLNTQRTGGVPGTSLSNMFVAGLAQIAGTRVSDSDTVRTNNLGFDGFFLDTLDTAGPYPGPGYYPWAAPEMQNTVKFIHDSYTNKVVFANRGIFFYNPLLINTQFGVQPYAYSIRPYVHAALFESYMLDSSTCDTNVTPYANDNKYDYARKICAESNRPDGFTMFCLDYQINRGNAMYELAMNESVCSNGWVEYLCPNGALNTVGTYALTHPRAADTAAPVWDSTATQGLNSGDITDCPGSNVLSPNPTPARVGVQALSAGQNPGDVVVHWDVALDQTPPIQYNIYHSTDLTFTNPVVYSNVVFQVGDGWAVNPVTSFANQYTVSGLTPGVHFFRVRAQDSSTPPHEDTNTVTLSIVVGNTDNPVVSGAIVVDGNLSDWAPLVSFGTAPQAFPVSSTNPVDLAQIWMAHDATNFYVAYQNYGPTTNGLNSAYNLYLDTDGSRSTGYRGGGDNFPIGADYLLQGSTLYRYTGLTGTDWSWEQVGVANSAILASNVEFSLPRSWLGSPSQVHLFFLGDNTALPGGTMQQQYPSGALQTGGGGGYLIYLITDVANSIPSGSTVVNGDLSDWASRRSFGVASQLFPIDPSNLTDLAQVWMAHDATNFYIAYQNYGPITTNSFGWAYALYLDTDGSRATGFRGGLDNFPIGADYLLQGATLYQYTGTNGTDWSWSLIGTAIWACGGSNVEISLTRAWIANPALIRLFFWGDNTAYGGSGEDLYPASALNVGGGGSFDEYRNTDFSNPVASGAITVNGNLSDWIALASFGLESQDFQTTVTDPVDLARMWIAHDATNLYVALQNYGLITNGLNSACNVFFDTDNNRSTGFRGGANNYPVGAEYLLQGSSIYHYTGTTGTDWNWTWVGTASSSVSGSNAEFSLPRAWIGNPEVVGVFFYGDNPSIGGSQIDVYPDSSLQTGGGGGFLTYRLTSIDPNVDSVGDGIPDWWRRLYFKGSGLTTNSQSCAACDPDGDGRSNLQEYLAGTDPTNSASAFRITGIVRQGADIRVTWMAGSGRTNVLQVTPSLARTYSNVSPNLIITGSGGTTNYVDTGGATNAPGRYYRVRLVP